MEGPDMHRKIPTNSFSHARNMEGPDMHRKIPTNSRGNCHHARENNAAAMLASAVPMAPRASPIAAKIPMLRPMSNGLASFWASAVSLSMDLEASDMSAESLDDASFSSWSVIMRPNRL